ncbi:ComF family protein [Selenomonas ruminis]|uniref:ComF family protein n=2 Tax=Selenomonadaceae TaxID=1843491 RepID=A0A5D6WBB7_9FIRM|nr:ComF family protein [Selenomonas sp.]TYZ23894.1 ComF family protein [Selenomonas sp. mPRGC5]
MNFIFPPHCPFCHKYVENRGDWCKVCLELACQPHRLPITAPMQSVIDSAWALSVYRGGTRDLIRGLKYHNKRSNLPYITRLLQAAEQSAGVKKLLSESCCAVAVPLHETRQRKRGFNQAELIFGDWLCDHSVPMEKMLRRVRQTKPLYPLTARERADNLKDAFQIEPGSVIRGKSILLVDDILTTGATLYTCAKVLKQAGAEKIYALVLASDQL